METIRQWSLLNSIATDTKSKLSQLSLIHRETFSTASQQLLPFHDQSSHQSHASLNQSAASWVLEAIEILHILHSQETKNRPPLNSFKMHKREGVTAEGKLT